MFAPHVYTYTYLLAAAHYLAALLTYLYSDQALSLTHTDTPHRLLAIDGQIVTQNGQVIKMLIGNGLYACIHTHSLVPFLAITYRNTRINTHACAPSYYTRT